MSKKKTSKFGGRVSRNSEKTQSEANFGYLNLPNGIPLFNPDGETVRLDFIPYIVGMENHPDLDQEYGDATKGEQWYRLPFKTHRDVGVEDDVIVCPTSFGKPCPICKWKKEQQKNGVDWEELKPFAPKSRYLYAVLPLGHDKLDEKIHIWDCSKFLFQNQLADELKADPSFDCFPGLEDGYTLKIRFTEKSYKKNKFYETARIDFEERKEIYTEDILKEVPCLDNLLIVLPYKELEAKFLEIDPDDIVESEDVEVVERTPSRRKKTVEPKPEEDVEETTKEEEKEEEEKEVEAPIRERRSSKDKEETIKEDENEKCPHGHKFGTKDYDDHDDCQDCAIWTDCMDAFEKNN